MVDDDFDIEFKFNNYKDVLLNLRDLKYNSAFPNNNEEVIRVHGLYRSRHNTIHEKCKDCKLYEKFCLDVSPFGNSQHFLHKNQMRPLRNKKVKLLENDYHTIISNYSHCPISRVNFVLNPKKSDSDPVGELFDESLVERNLEKMFGVNSLGSSFNADDSVSDYDKKLK